MHPLRLVLVGALPLAILAGSPQRVALSALIAAVYVVGALAPAHLWGRGSSPLVGRWRGAPEGQRRRGPSRILIVYLGAAAAWMVVEWLRSRFFLHLHPDQLSYATSKTGYFVVIVLPMAAAVAAMVDRPEDIWPAAATQQALGVAVAVLTLVLLGQHFLGADRYSWQGNLIALGTVIAVQPWLIRNLTISAILGVIGVGGVIFAASRQAVLAFILALLFSATYWAAAAFVRANGTTLSRLKAAVMERYVLLPLALVLLTVAYVGLTYFGLMGVRIPTLGLLGGGGGASSASCHCVTDRIVSLESSAGDRDKLLAHGVHLFQQHPILGAGLGSFAGAVPDSLHPGTFYQYPHNVLLEAAAETGLIGFVLLFVPLLAGWAVLFWNGVRRGSGAIGTILAITAVFFTVANVSGDIPSERGLWIFGIVAFKLGLDFVRTQDDRSALIRAA